MKRRRKHQGDKGTAGYILPSIIGVAVLYAVPFIMAQKYAVLQGGSAFRQIFGNTGFTVSIKNTFVFISVFVPVTVVAGLILAFMTEYMKLGFWVQAAVIIPITVPASSVSGFFKEVAPAMNLWNFNGLYIVGLIFLWSCIGYTYIIFLVSLRNRDRTIEEAARIDGAGTFRTIFSVILPMHGEATVLAIIVSIYNSLKIFRMTYAIFGEYPDYKMFMIQNFLHIKLKQLDMQVLMAAADMLLAFILLLLFLILALEKRHKEKMSS